MRSSCIRHPEREPLILIRKWQVDFCNGDKCAAALLSFFEYWHNIKLDQAAKAKSLNSLPQVPHKDGPIVADDSLYQFHTTEELEDGILHLYKRDKIRKSLDFLVELGAITIHRNPCKRYGYDKTKYFLFYPEVMNNWLSNDTTPATDETRFSADRSTENRELCAENRQLSAENRQPIAEITLETTKETSHSDDGFSNFFKNLKSDQKKTALKEAEAWFQNLPEFKKEKVLRPIRAVIKKRDVLNEEAYTGACLYNMMKAEEKDPDYSELEFVMRDKMNWG